jgi:hypothetical protein
MTPQEMLEQMIDTAWADYVDLHKAEIDSDYDDAMDGFERKEAEGYAMGLEAAYALIYNKQYESKVPEFDPYDYEDNQG